MSQNKKNLPPKTTLLRTQSYIINGEPNPLSDIQREKYFSKYFNFGKGKIKKINLKRYKKYINLVKKHKNKKFLSCDKKNKSKMNKIIYKEEIKDEENLSNTNYKENEKNISKNDSIKNKKVNLLINNNKEENKEFGNNKKKQKNDALVNEFQNMKINIPLHISNQDKEKNNIIHNYDNEYCFNNESLENNNINIPNLIKNNNNNIIYSNDIRHHSRYNSFDNNNDETYNKIYTKNLIKKNNNIFTLKKDKLFANKKISNYDEELNDINSNNNNNYKLPNESNYYTKRENYNTFRNYRSKITKEILKPIKKLNKEKSMLNTNLIIFLDDNNKINSTQINKIPKSQKIINSYKSDINTKKKYIKYSNYLNEFCKYIKERNNKFSSSIKYYSNNTYEEEKYRPISYKSISNQICSMREELETNKFIKELNRNNKLYKSKKNMMFSFNNKKNDEFFSPNKTFMNNRIFLKKDIKNNFDYKQIKQKKWNSIKKNKTFNIYRRNNYSGINFKSCINIINFINNNKCNIDNHKIIFPPNNI